MPEIKSTYRTLKEPSSGIFKEKGSKFIGIAVPCFSEIEAKQFLLTWRKEHFQARHVCYAYRFGADQTTFRSNDDGEPNNSAGIPILGQIQSFDLSNVLIGVIRYFGGTKLGVGGLIQAYKTAAKEAIENGEIVECEIFEHIRLRFDYSILPQIMNYLKSKKLIMEEQILTEGCVIGVALKTSESKQIIDELSEIEGVQLEIKGIY